MTKVKTLAGTELSEEDIEALASEAERGYDLDKAIRVTVGRPSLGSEGVSPRVQVRVDSGLAEALQARGAEAVTGIDMTTWAGEPAPPPRRPRARSSLGISCGGLAVALFGALASRGGLLCFGATLGGGFASCTGA